MGTDELIRELEAKGHFGAAEIVRSNAQKNTELTTEKPERRFIVQAKMESEWITISHYVDGFDDCLDTLEEAIGIKSRVAKPIETQICEVTITPIP